MTLVLYDYPLAPSPRRARVFLAEKQIPHETVTVDLRAGEQFSDAYKAINPACTVPALQTEDGTVICENAGIAAFAEAYKPEPSLLGRTPEEKGLIAGWNARIEFEGLMAVAEVVRNSLEGLKGRALTGPHGHEQIPALAERGRLRFTDFLEMLNVRLKGREFIATDSFSYADITALVAVDFAKWVHFEPTTGQDDLRRWHSAVSARPGTSA